MTGISRYNGIGSAYQVVTSTTRPSNPYTGMEIYETDTGWVRRYNGSSWILVGGNTPRARVYNDTTWTHNSNSNSIATTFNSERYDIGNCHSSGLSSRLTVPSGGGGLYAMGGSLHFVANATGRRILTIRLNGSTSLVGNAQPADATYGNYLSVNTEYELAANDYVELVSFQDSGGNLTASAVPAVSPEFWFRWVAPPA